MALELCIWKVDESSFILVLILVCLLKQMWGFSQASIVKLDSFGIIGLHGKAQRYWIDHYAYYKTIPPMLQSLWVILMHMLEPTETL